MAASELRKKAAYFLIFAGVLTLILVLFPFLEDWIKAALAAKAGYIIAPDGTVTVADGTKPDMMIETSISLAINVLHVVKIFILMALVISIVRFVSYLITKAFYRNVTQGEIASLLRTVLSIIVYIVSFFIIFQSQFPGVQLAPLFTGSTILGIVVGLALQDTLGNLFAGLALQADQPFQVGDVIAIPNRGTGVVESVSWRGVKIRTFQNKLLIISNSALGKESIEVAPKNNLNARLVFFSTPYTDSPAHTVQTVREAIRLSDNVSQKMRPIVRIRDLGINGLDWEVKYWLDEYHKYNDSDAMVRERIWYAFQRENIEFAVQNTDVHIQRKQKEIAHADVLNTRSERLNRVSIFTPLSDEEIEKLAASATTRIYAPGEAIVRKGQERSAMFVIVRGEVKIQIPENDYQRTINTLAENDFFGEMSLLTGEPRSANVIATEETEVLRIDKAGLKPILENNPQLVETICDLMHERKAALNTDPDQDEESTPESRKGVMRSIKKFFGLK